VGDLCLAYFSLHGKNQPLVQFVAQLDRLKLQSSMASLSASVDMSTNQATFKTKVNPNSLRILRESGYDFQRPFTKKLEDSLRRRAEQMDRKVHENIMHLTSHKVPVISENSKRMVESRGSEVFQKLYEDV